MFSPTDLLKKDDPVFPFWLQFDVATLVGAVPAFVVAIYSVLTMTVFRA